MLLIRRPTVADKWQAIAAEKEPLLSNREVQIHPGELLDMLHNDQVKLLMLDVRDDVDYNLFHIVDAKFALLDSIPVLSKSLLAEPDNTVIVLMSNDQTHATEAWKIFTAESVLNVYTLEGGVNYWLDIFGHAGHEQCFTALVSTTAPGNDELRHIFNIAIGDRDPAADPDLDAVELDYVPKVKLQTKKVTTGGCG